MKRVHKSFCHRPFVGSVPGKLRALAALPCAKLIATHDLDFVLDACTRVLLMDGGRIVADGRPDELLHDRALLERHGLELPLSLSRI